MPRGDVGGELRRHQLCRTAVVRSWLRFIHGEGAPAFGEENRASSARAAPGDVSGRRRKTYARQQGSFLSNEKPGQSAGLIASVTFGN